MFWKLNISHEIVTYLVWFSKMHIGLLTLDHNFEKIQKEFETFRSLFLWIKGVGICEQDACDRTKP